MKKNSYVMMIGFVVSILLYTACSAQTNNDLTVQQFEKGIEQGQVQVLDVRTQKEYNSGHLKNAFLADWNKNEEFRQRVQHLDKTKPIYTYCLAGGRSSAAAKWLIENGFKEVYNLTGGIGEWKRSGKAVEGQQSVKQISLQEYLASIPNDKTVLVDIGAKWCPPCKKMEPVIDALHKANDNLFTLIKVDGGEQETLVIELNATAFPTFIIYKNGKEVWRKQGIVEKEELLSQLK